RLETTTVDLGEVARTFHPSAIGSAVVRGDAGRISQIIRNLTTNAVRHGGPEVEVEVGHGAGTGWLEVRDSGAGVDPDVAARIFTPFATTGQPGSTGLGLAVSHQLAQAMGGRLIYVRRDGWTVFRLELPAATAASISPSPVDRAGSRGCEPVVSRRVRPRIGPPAPAPAPRLPFPGLRPPGPGHRTDRSS